MNILSKPLILLAALMLLMATPLVVGTAHATTPGTSSGSIQIVSSVVTDSRVAGGNAFYTLTNTATTTGTFTGTLLCDERQLVMSSGYAVIHDTCVFTGSVDGHVGTAVLRLSQGHFVDVSGGTGDLANLRGQGTFQVNSDGSGTYSGGFHFDP